ncbi:MAG: hypothetical protein JXB07_21345 [Anaerolineae bacterium]|nr:hypothetical protein [Anaerolineae bacterium]
MAKKTEPQSEAGSPKPKEDVRGKGFAQILHDRARASAERLDALMMSLSTALLGVAFFALSTEVSPALTTGQRLLLLVVLPALGISVVAGMIGLRADVRRNLHHAAAVQHKEKGEKAEVTATYRKRDRWLGIERIAGRVQEIFFVIGILAVSCYAILRAVM